MANMMAIQGMSGESKAFPVSENIFNTSNRFVYSLMEVLYKLSEPSLKIVRRYVPNFGSIDISPIIVFVLLFLKS